MELSAGVEDELLNCGWCGCVDVHPLLLCSLGDELAEAWSDDLPHPLVVVVKMDLYMCIPPHGRACSREVRGRRKDWWRARAWNHQRSQKRNIDSVGEVTESLGRGPQNGVEAEEHDDDVFVALAEKHRVA